jgi:predicted DCC family thiol-disulfide oxidoreductase YuxK
MWRFDRHGRLVLCDFSTPDYDAASTGLAVADLSAIIHARWADGPVITGVDVFRAMWEAVGWDRLVRFSRIRLIEPLMLMAYAWFARNRLRLTGRSNVCSTNTCTAALSKPLPAAK